MILPYVFNNDIANTALLQQELNMPRFNVMEAMNLIGKKNNSDTIAV
jgi:hypothetical protein